MLPKSFLQKLRALLKKSPHKRDRIEEALKNAFSLLVVASEKAYPLDEETINAIVTMRRQYYTNEITVDTEVRFWQAYTLMAQAIHPITIDSVKANSASADDPSIWSFGEFFGRSQSLAQKCARNYKILSSLTLITLICLQVYWYIGYALVSDINTQTDNIDTLQDSIRNIQFPKSDQLDNNQKDAISSELSILKFQLSEHKNWKKAASVHLQNWNEVWSSLDLITKQPWQLDEFQLLDREIQERIQLVSAENTLQAISTYFLPMLYGLIGACFYILRQLPKEIEDVTFTKKSYTNYSLRLAQGPLAGILVSYFVTPPNTTKSPNPENIESLLIIDPGINSLSPLALAFVAGYSVEFIFKILDKILSLPLAESESKSRNTLPLNCPLNSKSLKQKENS